MDVRHENLVLEGDVTMRYARAALWTLFVVLLVANGLRLLFGCAVTIPASPYLQYCRADR